MASALRSQLQTPSRVTCPMVADQSRLSTWMHSFLWSSLCLAFAPAFLPPGMAFTSFLSGISSKMSQPLRPSHATNQPFSPNQNYSSLLVTTAPLVLYSYKLLDHLLHWLVLQLVVMMIPLHFIMKVVLIFIYKYNYRKKQKQ